MISGFFLSSSDNAVIRKRLKKRIPKIGILLLVAFVIYGGQNLITFVIINNGSFLEWISLNFCNYKVIEKVFLGTFFCGPMWFLYAQIWAYILLIIWIKKFRLENLYIPAIILLAFHIISRTIVRMMDVSWYSAEYFRSAILYALPFMVLGTAIADKKIN